MELINQVCSLELAIKLKELGVKQESYFSWYGKILASVDRVRLDLGMRGLNCYGECEHYSAFTSTELGEMLPDWFESCKRSGTGKIWSCRVFDEESCKVHHAFSEKEANSRAQCLVYLLENNLVELNEKNKY